MRFRILQKVGQFHMINNVLSLEFQLEFLDHTH